MPNGNFSSNSYICKSDVDVSWIELLSCDLRFLFLPFSGGGSFNRCELAFWTQTCRTSAWMKQQKFAVSL